LLTSALAEVDAAVLVLALAGSNEELTKHLFRHLPKRVTRAIRQQLRRLGPTRLSDVEAAQRAVAVVASRQWATARMNKAAAIT
jgi:flagellar motor switch protein FliG